MAGRKLTVVISQHQGKHPAKRQLEEELAVALMMKADVNVSIVPNLYDLSHDHTGTLFLKGVPGDLIVMSWVYPRAARWILDRAGVKGRPGTVLIQPVDADDDWEPPEEAGDINGIGPLHVPNRLIYCVDLKDSPKAETFLAEVDRILAESRVETIDLMEWIHGDPQREQLQRYLQPDEMFGRNNNASLVETAEEAVRRRWYPVIDYDRCTNCMECIDFCLFGVYGVDTLDRILVENQDSCKKGCPACSRVCPENAIVFPQHKTPAIAGAEGEVAALKIDLSKLFGGGDALEMAVRERDIELVRDGRDAVGAAVGLKRRNASERDELDDLIDSLDELNL